MLEVLRSMIAASMRETADAYKERTGADIYVSLQQSLGRVLLTIAVREGKFSAATNALTNGELQHICDWLVAAHLRNEAWLSRVNNDGVPLKLAKFGTVGQIIDEANKAMAKRRGDGSGIDSESGIEMVFDCGDGWSVVQLTTSEALRHEGQTMGHCVGQGGYDQGLASGNIQIYSLRDQLQKSHVTIEIEIDAYSRCVNQIKGKGNAVPKADYIRKLVGWNKFVGLTAPVGELPFEFAIDTNGGLVELPTLLAGDVFEGDLTFYSEGGSISVPLTAGVVVNGDVIIATAPWFQGQGKTRVTLPERMDITGSLSLTGVVVDGLDIRADRLLVGDSTIMGIKKLAVTWAEFLMVSFADGALERADLSGNLIFENCHDAVFYNTTAFKGMLSIAHCVAGVSPIAPVRFEDGFHLKGAELDVENSFVAFEGSLRVGGYLSIHDGSVVEMPASLSVGKNLIVRESQIDRWPEHLDVRGLTVESSITVTGSQALAARPPMRGAA
jgi:hypothetical protein